MKKNIKTIIGLIIAFVIGISTTVTAATVFNSKDITYSGDKTTKTNVKDSLDELYTKVSSVGQCPEGKWCVDNKIGNIVRVGDYISLTPTSTSYTIAKATTGYTSDQTINPSELNLWRVIQKNSNGTIDVVSEYVSSTKVYFKGQTGYLNYIGGLNTIASAYTNTKYVSKTRHMGYRVQTEYCSTLSSCPSESGMDWDMNYISEALGTLIGETSNGTTSAYWAANRYPPAVVDGKATYGIRFINESGEKGAHSMCADGSSVQNAWAHSIRPILTLKADVQIKSGDGQSASTAFQLN